MNHEYKIDYSPFLKFDLKKENPISVSQYGYGHSKVISFYTHCEENCWDSSQDNLVAIWHIKPKNAAI